MPAMLNAQKVLHSFVPISRFNKGEAGKIISEVQDDGVKFVVRNNVPECVMLSLSVYERILEDLEDYELAAIALERESRSEGKNLISHEEMMARYGITQADLDAIDDSEIELA